VRVRVKFQDDLPFWVSFEISLGSRAALSLEVHIELVTRPTFIFVLYNHTASIAIWPDSERCEAAVATRSIAVKEGSRFRIIRDGDIDIEVEGKHLGGIEEFEGNVVERRLSLYLATDGKYVLSYSGAKYNKWGEILDSAQDVMHTLLDRNQFLGTVEKLLLEEVGKRDPAIRAISRIRAGTVPSNSAKQEIGDSNRMSQSEIMKVVNRYIGVSGGYLGDFSYRSHQEFYPEYCNLDINTYNYFGTTRERFIAILSEAEPRAQAAILKGVLERFPIVGGPATRTPELYGQIVEIARRIEAVAVVPIPTPAITSAVLERALADTETLIRTNGATSGVDRVHTALHVYMLAVCNEAKIAHQSDESTIAIFKLLREQHPKLKDLGPRSQDLVHVLRSISAIIDALNPVRNQASVAHPNEELLDTAEAMLVINVSRTILHYLNARLS
jgi:Abortive infection C-terminus